jgi:hypothetical protein
MTKQVVVQLVVGLTHVRVNSFVGTPIAACGSSWHKTGARCWQRDTQSPLGGATSISSNIPDRCRVAAKTPQTYVFGASVGPPWGLRWGLCWGQSMKSTHPHKRTCWGVCSGMLSHRVTRSTAVVFAASRHTIWSYDGARRTRGRTMRLFRRCARWYAGAAWTLAEATLSDAGTPSVQLQPG